MQRKAEWTVQVERWDGRNEAEVTNKNRVDKDHRVHHMSTHCDNNICRSAHQQLRLQVQHSTQPQVQLHLHKS